MPEWPIQIIRRDRPLARMRYLSPLMAIILMMITGLLIFLALGRDPMVGFYTFFIRPVSSLYGFGELLLKATPLMLCGIGLAIGFRANVWNIGAEGQFMLGAAGAAGVALYLPALPGYLLLPLMVLGGALAGMAWSAIPAWLKTRFNANEILVSLMLVYVAGFLVSWLVFSPWRDPMGFGFPQTEMFASAALLPRVLEGTRLNAWYFPCAGAHCDGLGGHATHRGGVSPSGGGAVTRCRGLCGLFRPASHLDWFALWWRCSGYRRDDRGRWANGSAHR